MSLYDSDFLEGLQAFIESPEAEDRFRIDDDHKAEWAVRLIADERAEAERLNAVRQQMIADYTEQIRRENERLERRTSALTALLMDYFETVPHKGTKTQESYQLPSGKLMRKYPAAKIERDDAAMIAWLRSNDLERFIKVKESPAWDELKKSSVSFDSDGCAIYTPTGEIMEGVAAVPQEPVFRLELTKG